MRKALLLGLLVLAALGGAGSATSQTAATTAQTGSDVILDDDAKLEEVAGAETQRSLRAALAPQALAAAATPALGTEKFWYSRSGNSLLRDRPFKLRAI